MITPQNTSLTQNTNTKILFLSDCLGKTSQNTTKEEKRKGKILFLSDGFGKNPYYPVNFKMSKSNYSLLLTLRLKINYETQQTTKP